jgi:putative membrane protein
VISNGTKESALQSVYESLPHVNASLNALATVLLIVGFVLIKRRQEVAHKWTMLACFGVSVVFLASYLTHHWYLKYVVKLPYGSHLFPAEYPVARAIYLAILIPHVILAAAVPVLALLTMYLGFADKRTAHRRLAKWTFPIWLYVSITGVLVYVMRYQLYPPA